MTRVELIWQGPFPLFNPKSGETVALHPEFEGRPGIYLWCSEFNGKYRVNYVGQSKYLANRLREQISKQLNGASVILKSDILQTQGAVERLYTPVKVKWMIEYLKDFPHLSMQAYRNLTLYSLFVAIVEPSHISKLKLIESGIINALFSEEETKSYVLNTGLSKLSDPKNPIQLLSDFEEGHVVVGVNQKIIY